MSKSGSRIVKGSDQKEEKEIELIQDGGQIKRGKDI